jgi:putative flavoprotein involved in K+ transport
MSGNSSNPTQQLSQWLQTFDAALQRGDVDAVMAMFDDDSYWRDMLTFTWNIKTLEGKEQIQAMLQATLSRALPSHWQPEGEATEADGVTDGWVTFETAQANGRAHIRLKGDKCWTLLTTMVSLKGHEEPKADKRPRGVDHGVFRDRKNWAELKAQREAALGYTEQPYCLIVGGGQGGIGLGARLRRLGVPTQATHGATDTSRSRCTTRSGTTTCPTCRSRTTGRCFRPKTRSATGSRCTPR